MEIVIFRHGQTDWNVAKRLQGSTDVPLNETGVMQAKLLGERLQDFTFDLIVTSDLSRAHETAKAVTLGRNIPIRIDKRLRELGLGEAEGKTHEELVALWGVQDFKKYNFPGRESASSVAERVNQVIDELMLEKLRCVALSSHGGVVWNWLAQIAGRDEVGRVDNTDAFLVRMDGGKAVYLGRVPNSNR